MKKNKTYISKCLLIFIISLMVWAPRHITAQQYDWEFDKIQKREQEKEKELDSILVHLKNRWEIKVAFGKWHLAEGEISTADELFLFPTTMNIWQFAGVWHFNERWSADISLGVQLQKDAPPTPDIQSVISGADVEIEGSGGAFLPVDLGLKYYFSNRRYKPYLGIGSGMAFASSKYIQAEGNLSNGITQTEFVSNNKVWYGKICTGLDYRIGKHTSASLNGTYFLSDTFDVPIGGYQGYTGFVVNLGFAIVL